MLPGGLLPAVGGRGGGLCLVRWLGLRMWSRRGTLVFALLWFGSWVFLNGLVLVHRSILSDSCTDDKSKRILQRLVSHIVFTGVPGLGSFVFICLVLVCPWSSNPDRYHPVLHTAETLSSPDGNLVVSGSRTLRSATGSLLQSSPSLSS